MLHSLGKFQGLFRFCTAQAAQARPTPKVAVFSAKVYDIKYFNEINAKLPIENRLKIDFFGEELNEKTAILTRGYDTIIPFVHDKLTSQTIKTLADVKMPPLPKSISKALFPFLLALLIRFFYQMNLSFLLYQFNTIVISPTECLELIAQFQHIQESQFLLFSQFGQNGVDLIALRCAGFNNTDIHAAAQNKIQVVRVPAYSPQAVAEHSMALLLCLVRKIHKAHNRTKEGNFNLDGLLGFNLFQKKVGIIGAGKIGQCFMSICKGFGMEILYYDKIVNEELTTKFGAKHVNLSTLFKESDVISLHCPLTFSTQYIIDRKSLDIMKKGAIIINTGRGKLMRTDEVIAALKNSQLGGVGLDVYEHEDEIFYKDSSDDIIGDDNLARLLMYPNVIVTGHQAFFTKEAITAICETTLDNIIKIKSGQECKNVVQAI